MEEEAIRPTTVNADTCRENKILSPPASTDHDNDRKLSVSDSDVRSYQDCVNLIFEKDADIENGVFCGLCLSVFILFLWPHGSIFDQRPIRGKDGPRATRRIGSTRLRFPHRALYDYASSRMGRSPSQGLGRGGYLRGTLPWFRLFLILSS